MAVIFPVFTNGAASGLAQLTHTGSNFQKPFTTAGLWATATQQSAGGLLGGTFSLTTSHQLVPILIGRRRYVTVFP